MYKQFTCKPFIAKMNRIMCGGLHGSTQKKKALMSWWNKIPLQTAHISFFHRAKVWGGGGGGGVKQNTLLGKKEKRKKGGVRAPQSFPLSVCMVALESRLEWRHNFSLSATMLVYISSFHDVYKIHFYLIMIWTYMIERGLNGLEILMARNV